jgi:polar amino acid transport system substrate-binding protein
LPWPRALEALERGKIDIVPYASDVAERKAFALFSKAYRNEVSGLVVRSEDIDQFPLTSVSDIALYNMKVAYLRGSYRGEAFSAFLDHPEAGKYVSEISISHHGLNLLLSGRIDAYVSDPVSTLGGAKKRGLEGRLASHPFILNSEPVHLMFSRATVSQQLVSRIDDAIAAEVETDRYASAYGDAAIGNSRAGKNGSVAELVVKAR